MSLDTLCHSRGDLCLNGIVSRIHQNCWRRERHLAKGFPTPCFVTSAYSRSTLLLIWCLVIYLSASSTLFPLCDRGYFSCKIHVLFMFCVSYLVSGVYCLFWGDRRKERKGGWKKGNAVKRASQFGSWSQEELIGSATNTTNNLFKGWTMDIMTEYVKSIGGPASNPLRIPLIKERLEPLLVAVPLMRKATLKRLDNNWREESDLISRPTNYHLFDYRGGQPLVLTPQLIAGHPPPLHFAKHQAPFDEKAPPVVL